MTKSWIEKRDNVKGLPEVKEVSSKECKWGEGKMVIPSPRDVDALMHKVPKGKLTTTNELRNALAKKYHADFTCPLTTGIFTWIAAGAAEEEKAAGKKNTTPYWRTLKKDGEVNSKYPGGVAAQRKLLVSEGHSVVTEGKKILVVDYQKNLYIF